MGLYKGLKYQQLAKPLNIVSFDYYPKWSLSIDYAACAMAHDVMRSLKKKPIFGYEVATKGRNWAELLSLREAKTLAQYKTSLYAGKPAATINNYGRAVLPPIRGV